MKFLATDEKSRTGRWLENTKSYFIRTSGGKKIIAVKRAGVAFGAGIFVLAVIMAWFGPKPDRTFYMQTNESQKMGDVNTEVPGKVSNAVANLLNMGKKKMKDEKQMEDAMKRKRVSVKYFASQIIGSKTGSQKVIHSGAKLVGFLLNPIDTRAPSPVRVRIAQGGEANGVEIERGSVLTGQFSYSGNGDVLYVSFSRLDTPDGDPKKIQAQALNSGSYQPGIEGESHSASAEKTAAQMGLTMFSGMADVLTEKESLGFSQNGVQAKPTMKNALLQGVSRSAQDQAARTASEISSSKDYLIVPAGKEMIIELTEEYK